MSTSLNQSIDRIFNEGLNTRLGKPSQATNPHGPNFGLNKNVSERGARIRTLLEGLLSNLEADVRTSTNRINSSLDRNSDRLDSLEDLRAERSLDSQPRMPDGRTVPNVEAIQTPEEAQQFIQALGLDNKPGWTKGPSNLFMEGISRVGDIASRPLYGLFEAAQNTVEALDEGQQPWETFDDTLYGLGQGLGGYEKTTPGEFYEYTTNPDVERNRTSFGDIYSSALDPGGTINRELREWKPENPVSPWVNRGLGFTGEVFGDPLNLVGAKGVSVASQAGKKTAKVASDDVLREAIPSYVDDALETAPDTIQNFRQQIRNTTGTYGKGQESIARQAGEVIQDSFERSTLNPGDMRIALQNQTVVDTLRSDLVASTRKSMNAKFEQQLKQTTTGRLSLGSARYKQLVKTSDNWRAFDASLRESLGIDEVKNLNYGDEAVQRALGKAVDAGREAFDGDILKFAQQFETTMRANMYNTVALRVGNQTLPIKFVGKTNKAVRERFPGARAPKAASYNRQLPGRAGLDVGNARRVGAAEFDAFRAEARKKVAKLTREERDEIGELRHIFGRVENVDRPMSDTVREGLQLLQDQYDEIYKRERAAGVIGGTYNPKTKQIEDAALQVENYQYIGSRRNLRNFKENQEALKTVKQSRRDAISSDSPWQPDSPKSAKNKGVRDVIDDPFEALAHRKLLSERLISRSKVSDSFFNHYGVTGNLSPEAARSMGLKRVRDIGSKLNDNNFKLNENLRALAHKEGDLYLPESIADAFQDYINMANFRNPQELGRFLQIYDKVLNFFKVTATVPYPGFHVKNMIGDIYLGYMDGIRAGDYTRYIRDYKKGEYKFHGRDSLGKEEWDALSTRYVEGSGFRENEYLPSIDVGTKGRIRATGEKFLDVSEGRENFARKVHFYKAINEELADGKSWEKALENASYRVNKWKFDYGALTYTEKQYFRRIIPFYTFMRKSAPAMIEGLMTHPSIYGKTYRFFDSDESQALAPRWMREIGFASPFAGTGMPFVGGEEEPLVVPQSVLPIDTFSNILGGSTLSDPSGIPEEIMKSLQESTSPVVKSILELPQGETLFTGSPIVEEGENPLTARLEYLMNNFVPPAATGVREVNRVREGDGFDLGEFLFGSRFALGVGGRRLDAESQMDYLQADLGNVKRELALRNNSLEPYGIRMVVSESQDATAIKVRPNGSRKDLYVGDLPGALKFVENYTSNPRNLISEGEEIVRYVTKDGKVKTGPANSSDLDRILD